MVHAATHGCTKITVILEGSCPNYLGTAASVTFYQKDGKPVIPVGRPLSQIGK